MASISFSTLLSVLQIQLQVATTASYIHDFTMIQLTDLQILHLTKYEHAYFIFFTSKQINAISFALVNPLIKYVLTTLNAFGVSTKMPHYTCFVSVQILSIILQ